MKCMGEKKLVEASDSYNDEQHVYRMNNKRCHTVIRMCMTDEASPRRRVRKPDHTFI